MEVFMKKDFVNPLFQNNDFDWESQEFFDICINLIDELRGHQIYHKCDDTKRDFEKELRDLFDL